MRMGGFIVGGLVGAAAAMYFSKNNRPMLATAINWDQAINKAGSFVKSAKSMWDTTGIMNNEMPKDPDIKLEVEKIMEDNNLQTPHPN